MMFLFALNIIWFFSWSTVKAAIVSKHDTSFTPDFSLRVSLENITQGCSTRESVVVNGTSLGPTLRIKSNKVPWIRVYNDMTDQNLTMVKLYCSSIIASTDN
jgi:L-ascorbate oxidase